MAVGTALLSSNGHILSAWGPPSRGPFLGRLLNTVLIIFGAQNVPQNEPKNDKNEPRNVTKQTTYSKTRHLQYFSTRFVKISEFLDTVDKLYISKFFVIRRCKPRTTSNIVTNMHPETHQNPTTSFRQKQRILPSILA